jgi:hypothetical protein
MRDFKALAEQRAMKTVALEWRDEWDAMPSALRDFIDQFNQLPADVRERSLPTLIDQPEVTEALGRAWRCGLADARLPHECAKKSTSEAVILLSINA